jgi:hypothetical protein
LKHIVADLTLDNARLKEPNRGNYRLRPAALFLLLCSCSTFEATVDNNLVRHVLAILIVVVALRPVDSNDLVIVCS